MGVVGVGGTRWWFGHDDDDDVDMGSPEKYKCARGDRGSASFHREVKDSVVRKRPWWRNLESSE